jgi:hypothetical protein
VWLRSALLRDGIEVSRAAEFVLASRWAVGMIPALDLGV